MITKSRANRIPITEIEQPAFCQTEKELVSKTLEEEFKAKVRWQKLPVSYMRTSPEELDHNISVSRKELGESTLILGHHYQRESIIKFADVRGDSFKLAQYATTQRSVNNIVFCGVHFMAETADILSAPNQNVILPNLAAGCSMADMAETEDVKDCWSALLDIVGKDVVTPVTYMNSTAAIKALCGKNEGIVCTSSNASATFEWAYEKSEKILFLPDQHLGRNTGLMMGLSLSDMIIWDPFKPLGGNSEESITKAKLILWKGHCSVHTRFTVEQIEEARKSHPNVKVVVHPECTQEVVKASDYCGSTEYIKDTIYSAPANTTWAVGTEVSLVNRIATENIDKNVFCLDPVVCPCSTMYRIHPAYLSWVLDGLIEGIVVNPIKVAGETRKHSRIALKRMLELA